jgi:hypothetical protein
MLTGPKEEQKNRHMYNENGNTLAMISKTYTVQTNVLISVVYISTFQLEKVAYNTYTLKNNSTSPDA